MNGRELLNFLQGLSEEVLAKPVTVVHPNGGYSMLERTSVMYIGHPLLHLSPGPTEAEKQVQLKEAESLLWGGIIASDDGTVAQVEPSDLKNAWQMGQEMQNQQSSAGGIALSRELFARVCSPDANVTAVWYRCSLLSLLAERLGLFPPELPDAAKDIVFGVAARFPMKRVEPGVVYQGLPLDVQGFVSQIEREMGNLGRDSLPS